MKKTILMNTETLDNDLIISEKNIKAGESFPLHWHDYFELEIIISGCIEHTHNQQKYIATAGNAYLMSYYDFHSFKAITDAHLIGIRFNDTVLCGELTAFISMGIHKFNCMYDKSELENIIEQLNKIAKENEGGQLFSRQIIINTVSENRTSTKKKQCRDLSNRWSHTFICIFGRIPFHCNAFRNSLMFRQTISVRYFKAQRVHFSESI